jgi:opacity protein-like surface antigen
MHMKKQLLIMLAISLSIVGRTLSQDLMDLLNDDSKKTDYAYATFKTDRIVLGQSIELTQKGALGFTISHHFGRVNEGWYEFWGLDQSNIRFGFDYGLTDWLAIGVGRTSVNKTYDGSIKVKFLRQSKGYRKMPITLSYYGNMAITSLQWQYPERKNYFTSRMEFTHQLMIARKFGTRLSLQLTPTYIHRNLVATTRDQNDVFAVGAGGRIKITNRLSINGEYYYMLPGKTANDFYNSFSFGIDLETGGHVFQIFLTNSQGLIEEQFIAGTTGSWGHGDIHIGFNIHRTFQLYHPKKK